MIIIVIVFMCLLCACEYLWMFPELDPPSLMQLEEVSKKEYQEFLTWYKEG